LLELGSSLEAENIEPVDLESLLREVEVFKLEFNVKEESMSRLTELGQTLVQDGQLSSMEVESRLGDIKTGFQNVDQTLLKTEELSYKNVSFKVTFLYSTNLKNEECIMSVFSIPITRTSNNSNFQEPKLFLIPLNLHFCI